MNKSRTLIFLSLICSLLTACGASGPIYREYEPANPDSSVIYIYRPKRTVNCCVSPAVYIDGAKKADLKNGGYLAYELQAGNYEVIVGDGSYGFEAQSIGLVASEGQSYYVKWVVGSLNQFDTVIVGGMGVGYSKRNYHLLIVPNERAQSEIADLKKVQP